jgi:NAD(P)-dependent dehydrogenase (short-subunit alcohol dehydrogenase family)
MTRAAAHPPVADPLGTVLVTGGGSGLGAATVTAIARAGGRPIVLDRVRATGAPCYEVDLADTVVTRRVVASAVEEHGGLDAVVTCAGVDVPGELVNVDPDDWERVVAVNLLGTAAVVRAALPSLIAQGGRVVTVASTLGHRAVSDATAYCASKFGVVGFTRALTAELRGRVGVTLLTPGGMRTAFFDAREERYRPPPDAKLCAPSDVADAIVFVLSRPLGCEIKELVVASPEESSWP